LAIPHVCIPFLPVEEANSVASSPTSLKKVLHLLCQTARPNSSLERTRTGMALGPPGAMVHHPLGGPGATPARSAQLKR